MLRLKTISLHHQFQLETKKEEETLQGERSTHNPQTHTICLHAHCQSHRRGRTDTTTQSTCNLVQYSCNHSRRSHRHVTKEETTGSNLKGGIFEGGERGSNLRGFLGDGGDSGVACFLTSTTKGAAVACLMFKNGIEYFPGSPSPTPQQKEVCLILCHSS